MIKSFFSARKRERERCEVFFGSDLMQALRNAGLTTDIVLHAFMFVI